MPLPFDSGQGVTVWRTAERYEKPNSGTKVLPLFVAVPVRSLCFHERCNEKKTK